MSTLEEKWPEKWPVKPIPTKPFNPPWIDESFKLHVEPQEFTICGLETTDPNYKPFAFRIKNPLDVEIEYLVESYSEFIKFFEDSEGTRGFLKPSEISKPIVVVNFPYKPPDCDEKCEKPWHKKALKIEISYCYVTPESKEETKKKWAEQWKKEEYRMGCYMPENEPPGLIWCLSKKSKGYFLPKVTLVPGPLLHLPWKDPFEKWEEIVDREPKRKCTIL